MSLSFLDTLGWVPLSANLKTTFNRALRLAQKGDHVLIGPEHLLLALVDDPEGAIALAERGIDRQTLRRGLSEALRSLPPTASPKAQDTQKPDRDLKRLMARASELAEEAEKELLDGGDVIAALDGFAQREGASVLARLQMPTQAMTSQSLVTETTARPSKSPQDDADRAEREKTPQDFSGETSRLLGNGHGTMGSFAPNLLHETLSDILRKQREAQETLARCPWYRVYRNLQQMGPRSETEAESHRLTMLSQAEAEIARDPECALAFRYLRFLEDELARLPRLAALDLADLFPKSDESEAERTADRWEDRESAEDERAFDPQDDAAMAVSAGSEAEGPEMPETLRRWLDRQNRRHRKTKKRLKQLTRRLAESQTAEARWEKRLAAISQHWETRFSDVKAQLERQTELALRRDAQLQSALATLAELQKTLSQREARREDQENRLALLTKRLREMEARLAEQNQAIRSLPDRLTALETRLKTLETQETDSATKLSDSLARAERLSQELQAMKSHLHQSGQGQNRLESRLSALEQAQKQRDGLETELSELLKKLDKSVANLEGELAQIVARNTEARETQERQLQDLSGKLASLDTQLQKLSKQVASQKALIATEEKRSAQWEARVDRLAKDLAGTQDKFEDLKTELSATSRQLARYARADSKAAERHELAEKQWSSLTKRVESLEERLARSEEATRRVGHQSQSLLAALGQQRDVTVNKKRNSKSPGDDELVEVIPEGS